MFVIGLLRCDVFYFLLRYFICVRATQTSTSVLISRRYRIMIVSMLKNWSLRYYSHYIIKFVTFITIYYVINLNTTSFYMVFNNLCFGSIDLLQV